MLADTSLVITAEVNLTKVLLQYRAVYPACFLYLQKSSLHDSCVGASGYNRTATSRHDLRKMCARWSYRSVFAFTRSDQNLHWHLLDSHWCKVFSCGQRRLKLARTDAQADFSLRWASLSGSTFSHVLVHIIGQLKRKCNSLKWLHFEVDSLDVSTALFGPTYRTTAGKCFGQN